MTDLLIEKYLCEGLLYVEVTDEKGKVISRMDSSKFLSIMEKEFKKFKFLQDAVKFYNQHYKNNKAVIKLNK